MIWLLTNAWWLVVIGVGLLAALHPAGWALIRAVPRSWWLVLAGAAVLGLTFQSGRWYERSVAEVAQEARDTKADVKAQGQHRKADQAAKAATATITKESADAAVQVRTIVRTLPATCPPVPAELRDVLQRQVEAARGGVPPA